MDDTMNNSKENKSRVNDNQRENGVIDPKLKEYYESHNLCNVEESLLSLSSSSSSQQQAQQPVNGNTISLRFVRLNPRWNIKETLLLLQQELNAAAAALGRSTFCKAISWLNTGATNDEEDTSRCCYFYAIDASFSLSQSSCFKAGRIYGMDLTSAVAILALFTTKWHAALSKARPPLEEAEKIITTTEKELEKDSSSQPVRVLDLCCAPGLKLCMIADWLSCSSLKQQGKQTIECDNKISSTIVGVDASQHRMALCKKIVTKYLYSCRQDQTKSSKEESNKDNQNNDHADSTSAMTKHQPSICHVQLYCADGVTFEMIQQENGGVAAPKIAQSRLVMDSQVTLQQQTGKRKRINKSARAREQKQLASIVAAANQKDKSKQERVLFDYVLVDAECSTDGSLKHVQHRMEKQQQQGNDNEQQQPKAVAQNELLTDPQQLQELVQLQRGLIASGFQSLKPGGSLVYSTCSLCHDQNENVVQWLLDQYPTQASLIPLDIRSKSANVMQGSLNGTIRFHPTMTFSNDMDDCLLTGCTGFFLAKITKRPNNK